MNQDEKKIICSAESGVRNIVLLGFISCFSDISAKMVYPLIPLYLTTVLGATPAIWGAVLESTKLWIC